jgi:hypothetical protein
LSARATGSPFSSAKLAGRKDSVSCRASRRRSKLELRPADDLQKADRAVRCGHCFVNPAPETQSLRVVAKMKPWLRTQRKRPCNAVCALTQSTINVSRSAGMFGAVARAAPSMMRIYRAYSSNLLGDYLDIRGLQTRTRRRPGSDWGNRCERPAGLSTAVSGGAGRRMSSPIDRAISPTS